MNEANFLDISNIAMNCMLEYRDFQVHLSQKVLKTHTLGGDFEFKFTHAHTTNLKILYS